MDAGFWALQFLNALQYSMLLFLLLPGTLARMLVEHDAVVAVAVLLIPIAGVFQIGDGLQVVAIGCLRGLGDVRSPVAANIVGFWLCGLPLGAWLLVTIGLLTFSAGRVRVAGA